MDNQREIDFHNTIPIEGEDLERANIIARTQTDMILDIFRRNPNRWFTPYEIQDITGTDTDHPEMTYMLITSVRRSITNLTEEGWLIKGGKEHQKKSRWGMNNNCWKYHHEQI